MFNKEEILSIYKKYIEEVIKKTKYKDHIHSIRIKADGGLDVFHTDPYTGEVKKGKYFPKEEAIIGEHLGINIYLSNDLLNSLKDRP